MGPRSTQVGGAASPIAREEPDQAGIARRQGKEPNMSGRGGGEGAKKGVSSGGEHIDTMKPGLSSGEVGGVTNPKGKVDPEKVFKAEPLTRRDRE